ncbi:SCP-2 sterol transfer family protein [Micromonospora echinaurantiaca]|uniref:SCP-2 sterol transfer family protein n=1 Tax=Micromonospora echinaurantiaca TaxID=47857 RepID=A0A1C5HN78_9ACTN|nr:SCP2 sterol-binding domain-containing protein [Micromonospora echinaurantiaca]SCG47439.1 SCP-2 sterol transfer family protein [Micromonospora echinaurantiaca]
MSDRTAEFFDRLDRRGHEPLFEGASGTLRVDLVHDRGVDRWFVVITHGGVHVTRADREADAVLRVDRALFDRFVTGEANIYAAWVRNELIAEGDVLLPWLLQRIMPQPAGARHPRTFVAERSRPA